MRELRRANEIVKADGDVDRYVAMTRATGRIVVLTGFGDALR
ncbi:hypothetical protein [Microbispora sp. H11081]|nr:hypothetical protein [Microbispora sp. H11081]